MTGKSNFELQLSSRRKSTEADFLASTMFEGITRENSNPATSRYQPTRFPSKNGDPDQRDFPVIMHSRWSSDTRWWMSPGAKRELSVSKRILRRPPVSQWFTNIFYSGTAGVSPLNPASFTCLIYSRLISPTDENSNRWNRLRAAAKSYNHDRLRQGIERPDIFRAEGSREPEAPGFYREN